MTGMTGMTRDDRDDYCLLVMTRDDLGMTGMTSYD